MLLVVFLVGCAQKDASEAAPDANAQHATVFLKDGSKVSGTVTASTPAQITLNSDSGFPYQNNDVRNNLRDRDRGSQ